MSLILLVLGPGYQANGEETPRGPGLSELLEQVSVDRMLADVAQLAGRDMEGRQTGTAGDRRSALFVARRFQALGLTPAGDSQLDASLQGSWFMEERWTGTRILEGTSLKILSPDAFQAKVGKEYLPVLDSPSVEVAGPVVFVGYGISDPDRELDEYQGVRVKDRIVLFLRGAPPGYPVRVPHAQKQQIARSKGAIAYLTVTGPILSPYEARRGMSTRPLAYYGSAADEGPRSLPGAWISPELANRVVSGLNAQDAGSDGLRSLQHSLNAKAGSRSGETGVVIRMSWQTMETRGSLINVQAVIPGTDSTEQATVILGAHRDHFGRQAGLLFPGADDNASGTAVLLEVARILSEAGIRPRRSVLFLSFSGEEQGLRGSRLYVAHPVNPLDATIAMINVDHAGVGNGRLTVGVQGLPRRRAELAGEMAGLREQLDLYGYFPGGDHVPFKQAGVPTVAIVSGGPHPHFHQPSDRVETLQRDVLLTIARYVLVLTWLVSQDD